MDNPDNNEETSTDGDDTIRHEIVARGRKGEPAYSIASDLKRRGLGEGYGKSQIAEILKKEIGIRRVRRGSPAKSDMPPLPDSSDSIPEDTPLETIDWWLRLTTRRAKEAERDGNLSQLAQMGRLTAMLLEAKRKATPDPVPDPNDNPDYIKMAAKAEQALLKMVDELFKPD